MDMNALQSSMEENKPEPPKKRVCLRHYDLVPSQMLNPMGESGIEQASLKYLWETMQKRNEATSYFSYYCSKDIGRQAIALSTFCEVMLAAIERVQASISANILKQAIYDEAMQEAKALKPYLIVLNRGLSFGAAPSSIYASSPPSSTDPAAVREAAEHIYEWLKKERSMLRWLVAFCSGAGIFFVAECHEKSSRAFLECYGLTKEQFVSMAAVPRAAIDFSFFTRVGW